MRAIVLEGDRVVFPRRPARADAGLGETLVRVLRAGVCETDLQLVRGYMGFRGILGHEFVGIAQVGPFAGRRVVGRSIAAAGSAIPVSRDDRLTALIGRRLELPIMTALLRTSSPFLSATCTPYRTRFRQTLPSLLNQWPLLFRFRPSSR